MSTSVLNRRMQMVILSSPQILESIKTVHIRAPMDSEKFSGLSRQFIPWLRYHNPKIEWKWDQPDSDPTTSRIDIMFTDNTIETFSDNDYECYHEIAQAIIDADNMKTSDLKSLKN